MSTKKTIGKKIKSARTFNEMSQLELSKKINSHYKTLSKWELGQRAIPSDKLFEICKILNVDWNYFNPEKNVFGGK